jgi:hypothetical protein
MKSSTPLCLPTTLIIPLSSHHFPQLSYYPQLSCLSTALLIYSKSSPETPHSEISLGVLKPHFVEPNSGPLAQTDRPQNQDSHSTPSIPCPHILCPHILYPHTLCLHTLCPHTLCPHILCSHILCPHILCPHILCPHILCPHILCPHILCPHILCPHMLYPRPTLSPQTLLRNRSLLQEEIKGKQCPLRHPMHLIGTYCYYCETFIHHIVQCENDSESCTVINLFLSRLYFDQSISLSSVL